MGEPQAELSIAVRSDNRPASFVVDIDLAAPVPGAIAFRDHANAVPEGWVLVRFFDEPIGLVKVDLREGVPDDESLVATLTTACADKVTPRLAVLGLSSLPPEGLPAHCASPFLESRRQLLKTAAEHVTVVICTRERPEALRRALRSLAAQVYPAFDVLVVDNAPTTNAVAEAVCEMSEQLTVRRVVEHRPGLSRARNRALSEVGHGLLAWLDDDEEADPHWLAEIARGFADHPEATAVCGIVVPAELRTRPQIWFEQFGGHTKGRGFETAVFSPATWKQQHPLYPLPSFGVGANMAFRAAALHAIGGFDEALGAGTPTKSGEDTKAISQVLLRGESVVYQHSALTRHYHREDLAGLGDQLTGYGIGLTAYYLSMIIESPALVSALVKLAGRAYRDMTVGARTGLADIGEDFPQELLKRNVRGMLVGPARYLLTRWTQRGDTRRRSHIATGSL